MKNLRVILVVLLCSLLAASNAFALGAQTTATVTATVNSSNSISVNPATLAFGTIVGSSSQYRYKSPTAAVSYFAAGPYEIRVYTINGVGAAASDARGFIRDSASATANKLFLKIWCANFNSNKYIDAVNGPTFSTTSSQTNYLWTGYDLNGVGGIEANALTTGTFTETVLGQDINGDGTVTALPTYTATALSPIGEGASTSWIREKDTMVEGDDLVATGSASATRCILVCNTPVRGDKSLSNPFNVFFAADLTGVKNATYSSANNTVPIVGGQTATAGVTFELLLY